MPWFAVPASGTCPRVGIAEPTSFVVTAPDAVKPAEMSRSDLAGGMFDSPDTAVTGSDGGRILDSTSFLSSGGSQQVIEAGEAVTIPRTGQRWGRFRHSRGLACAAQS